MSGRYFGQLKASSGMMDQVGRNLWKREDGKYFRLFATGRTYNMRHLINPEMRELVEIDAATGSDVYGNEYSSFSDPSIVSGYLEFEVPPKPDLSKFA